MSEKVSLAGYSTWRVSALLVVALLVSGCATSQTRRAESDQTNTPAEAGRFSVSLPSVNLADSEFIQSVNLEVRSGRIFSVARMMNDWDYEVVWDTPDRVVFECSARHFSSGLSSIERFSNVITVQSDSPGRLQLHLIIKTSSCTPTGRPDREFQFEHETIRLRSLP